MGAEAGLLSNPWFVGSVVGIPGIVASVLLTYLVTRKVGLFRGSANTVQQVGPLSGKVPGFGLVFRGVEVPSLAVSKVAVWNGGNVAIKKESVDPNDPLGIDLSAGVRLLDLSLVHDSDPLSRLSVLAVKLPDGRDSVSIGFEHLKPRKGAVLQLLHTGSSNSDLVFRGSFIDYPPPEFVSIRRRWAGAVVSGGLGFSFGVIATLVGHYAGALAAWAFWASIGVGLAFLLVVWWMVERYGPSLRVRVPTDLLPALGD